MAPGLAEAPVYTVVCPDKGGKAVALSKEDGSLDRFLENLRFQQVEEDYFHEDEEEESGAQDGASAEAATAAAVAV